MEKILHIRTLMGASAIGLALASHAGILQAQAVPSCATDPAACGGIEAGTVISRDVAVSVDPAGPAPAPVSAAGVAGTGQGTGQGTGLGFAISLDGNPVSGDRRVVDAVRRTDIALSRADVQVSYDGLGATRRLSLEVAGPSRSLAAGDSVTLQSALNYPGYVTRGEFIVTAPDAFGKDQIIARLPVAPNGQASYVLPTSAEGLAVRHRVYDATGRYDETEALPLLAAGGRGLADGVEDGHAMIASRNIPASGGAITVSGTSSMPNSLVTVMGETVRTDSRGGFVLQRILPAGVHAVPVNVGSLAVSRDVDIPANEMFATGIIDLTFGATRTEGADWRSFNRGRLAFYVDGRTADGVTYRLSADTTQMPLDDLFSRLDQRDPRNLLTRLDPRDVYPTFGDDSTIEDRTPTSGQIYARVQREQDYLLWGDFRAGLDGNSFATNDRNLYGLQGHAETRGVTANGEARGSVTLHAANSEEIGQRDVLRATGGSYYQLSKADISRGTETVWVQVRNATTGRVISAERLQEGVDYDLNAVQGGLMLRSPLYSGTDEAAVYVVAQYEYRPTASDIDGYVVGGRAEGWLNDQIRLGLSVDQDDTAGRDAQVVAADALWQLSDGTWFKVEGARSEGAGVALSSSADGGLGFDSADDVRGGGDAYRVEMAADLADFGAQGVLGAYVEHRDAGFANGDIRVANTTRGEDLWGVKADLAIGESRRLTLSYDAYETGAGERDNLGRVMLRQAIGSDSALSFGLEHRDLNDLDDEVGARLDAVVRYERLAENGTGWWVFGTTLLDDSGLGRDDRYGIGARAALPNGWTALGEISGGDNGAAGRLEFNRDDREGGTRYVGWQLEADRDVDNVVRRGSDLGRFITGARQEITPTTAAYGETSYDIFGRYRTLTNAYGLNYTPTQGWAGSIGLQLGTITDGDANDFERRGVSIGVTQEDEDVKSGLRVEYRNDFGLRQGREQETESWLIAASTAHRLSADARLVTSAEMMRTRGDAGSTTGDYTDISVGYAYRPVEDNRLNLLARYRYLNDQIGQNIDGIDRDGPRQESHVFSVDALWRLDPNWTLGTKFGYRASETAANATSAFAQNDAWLAAGSVKWHVVHNWDAQLELRVLETVQGGTTDLGAAASVYRHINDNVMLGVGYNFGRFSDDLTDLTQDDQGLFVNLVTHF